MQNFIILGFIPGTQLQVTFLIWTFVATSLLVVAGLWLLHRRHVLRNWLIGVLASRTIRRRQLA